MTGLSEVKALDLTHVEYILDPPDTIWKGVLKMDHATWLEVKDLVVIRQAEERIHECSHEITREAWLGLYASVNPLRRIPPSGMEVAHSIFSRAAQMPEWESLRTSIVADEIAAAFGAAHFSSELINRLPPEVKEKMERAQQAQNKLEELHARVQMQKILSSAGEGVSNVEGEGTADDNADTPGPGLEISSGNHEELEEQIREVEAASSARTREALEEIVGSVHIVIGIKVCGSRIWFRLGFGWERQAHTTAG
jgi:archaellum component FlaC